MAWGSDDSVEQGLERGFWTKRESNRVQERASQIRTTCARAFWSEILDDRMNKVESAHSLVRSNKIRRSVHTYFQLFSLMLSRLFCNTVVSVSRPSGSRGWALRFDLADFVAAKSEATV